MMPTIKGYYTGVGSRETPESMQSVIRDLAAHLAQDGWVLRSGGADGADALFEEGCDSAGGKKEIYLPWRGFNKNKSELHPPSQDAFELARKYHPSFNYLRHPAKLLMARNSHQVLGQDLNSPSTFLVCWTKDGCVSTSTRQKSTGGTGQAISIASSHSIPVFNLKQTDGATDLFHFLDTWF
jgi:hypothetical protein